jgi:protein O-mannosyl-transferase
MGTSESRRKKRQAVLHKESIPPVALSQEERASSLTPVRMAIVCFFLAAITLFCYQGVRHNDFLSYDDTDYVLQNRHIQQGLTWQSMGWAFTSVDASNWHPLTWISHMADWKLFGKNPAGHHLTNVVLHAMNAVLLFLLLVYATGYWGRAMAVALLFALHPLHVESVAWIAERKDVLSTFFWFGAMLMYVWYVRKPSWKRFACIIAGFAGGLLSKPMVVTLPFALLLFDYWPLRRIPAGAAFREQLSFATKLIIEKWPLFAMAIASSCITFYAQKAGGAVTLLAALPFWTRCGNAVMSYGRYLAKMFWPDPLMTYYHHEATHINIFLVALLFLLLALITFVCWRVRNKKPYCIVGWLWYAGTLVPVIGIVQVGVQAMAERYTYVPLVGVMVALVWLVEDAIGRFSKIKIPVRVVAALALAVLAGKSVAQIPVWKNTVTLFSHVLEYDPRGEFPNLSLGAAYLREGKLASARHYLERALTYNPSGAQTLSYYAFCLMQTHRPEDLAPAQKSLERAIRVAPDNRDVLTNMAEFCLCTGKPADAEKYCRKIIAASPEFITARFYLADALQEQNKLAEAAEQYRAAIAVEPANTDAHNNLGIIYGKQGLTADALREFRASLALKPDQGLAHANIGRVLMETHQVAGAVKEFTEAIRFDPANAIARNNLGVAFFELGDFRKAGEQFTEAVRIDSTYADAKKNLGLTIEKRKSKK